MFDLASDAAMKQVLEGSAHRVSIHTRDLAFEGLFVLAHVSLVCTNQGVARHVRKCEGLLLKVRKPSIPTHKQTTPRYSQTNIFFLCVMKSLSRSVEETDLFTLDVHV